jgi:hypothetical protein
MSATFSLKYQEFGSLDIGLQYYRDFNKIFYSVILYPCNPECCREMLYGFLHCFVPCHGFDSIRDYEKVDERIKFISSFDTLDIHPQLFY